MNYEAREMKDDLNLLAWELEGRDKKTINDAIKYINELENMLVEKVNCKENTDVAIKLLKSKGYSVRKITESMIEDCNACEASGWNGDCCDCSCSVCIIQ